MEFSDFDMLYPEYCPDNDWDDEFSLDCYNDVTFDYRDALLEEYDEPFHTSDPRHVWPSTWLTDRDWDQKWAEVSQEVYNMEVELALKRPQAEYYGHVNPLANDYGEY